jgi:hypothetical protein
MNVNTSTNDRRRVYTLRKPDCLFDNSRNILIVIIIIVISIPSYRHLIPVGLVTAGPPWLQEPFGPKDCPNQEDQAEEDEQDRPVFLEVAAQAKGTAEDGEGDQADDDQAPTAAALAGQGRDQVGNDRAGPDEARDQGPHVRPGAEVIGGLLDVEDPANPQQDAARNGQRSDPGEERRDQEDEADAANDQRPGEALEDFGEELVCQEEQSQHD